jgi:galactoside O-acetyltransferase
MYDLSLLRSCGEDVYVSENVVIKNPQLMDIDSHVAIDAYFYCTPAVKIGSYCHISSHVSIVGGKSALLIMGDFSHLAAGARLIVYGDENLGEGLVSPVVPAKYRDKMVGGKIIVGNFATIGTNAVISPGVTIGEGAVVAANSFVRHDIPPWQVWGGTPARFLKKRDSETMIQYANELTERGVQ